MLIQEYTQKDREALISCFTYIQEVERKLDVHKLAPSKENISAYIETLLSKLAQKEGKMFLAKEHDAILGVITVYIELKEEEDLTDFGIYGYISDLGVLPEYQKQGIGKVLLTYAEEYLKEHGAQYLVVEALENNVQAIRFYTHTGFDLYEYSFIKKL